MSCVTVHKVVLGISILQKNLLFTFTNLSNSGINKHRKVTHIGMLRKGFKGLLTCV